MIKMMVTVVVVYALCWLPLHTITILGDFYEDIFDYKYFRGTWIAIHWLAMSNCCYNPVVYGWMSANFRSGYKETLSRFCCLLCTTPADISTYCNTSTPKNSLSNMAEGSATSGGTRVPLTVRYYSIPLGTKTELQSSPRI